MSKRLWRVNGRGRLRIRALACALFAVTAGAIAGQTLSVLHIKVSLATTDVTSTPIARHALLVSDEPVTSAPRRVVTGIDGTVDVRLKPGRYTIESEQPVTFRGRSYQWTQTVTVAAGDAVLELTAANADSDTETNRGASDPGSVFDEWRGSVFGVWSETSHGLGFLVDPTGLVVTTQHVVDRSATAEVQVTPTVKVAARIVAQDPKRNVAVLWMDPARIASARPVRLGYAAEGKVPIAKGQELVSVGSGFDGKKFMTTAIASGVEASGIDSDIIVDRGNSGAPVFAPDGHVVGITTLAPPRDDAPSVSGIIRIDEARGAIAEAASKTRDARPPADALLPVEPARPFPESALEAAVRGRAPNTIDYRLQAADFDVTLITPVLTYGVQYRERLAERRGGGSRSPMAGAAAGLLLSIDTFENWADYVANFPPVVMVRATPRLEEGFWSMLGRQAAQTQGVTLPALKRAKTGFADMHVFCGEAEVMPIHRFRILHTFRARDGNDTTVDVVREGLYVFDPNALGPPCGSVKVVLFSTADSVKGDARLVEEKTLQQIWKDFASWR